MGRQSLQLGKSVTPRLQNDNGETKRAKIRLKRKIPVDCNKHVEFLGCAAEQITVLDAALSHLLRSLDDVPGDVGRQAPVETFIE
jgi:hypothetical protein